MKSLMPISIFLVFLKKDPDFSFPIMKNKK